MSAPSGTIWGSTVSDKGCLGLYHSLTVGDTSVTVAIEVWFWSKWGVTDSSNTFYFNNNATSATTSKGSVSIKHTVSSGSGWSTSNQTKLGSYSFTYTRGTSDVSYSCAAKLSGIEAVSSSTAMTVTTKYTIPKKATTSTPTYLQTVYVRYQNADGSWGSYSSVINASYTSGATVSWSRSADTTYVAASVSYTAKGNTTTYVDVKRQTYKINYNANGGKCPPTQSFLYGCDLHLTEDRPTRSGYKFLGWSKTSTATSATYTSGGAYSGTDISAPTLYAVWSKRSQSNSYLYNNGKCYTGEYIEGQSLGFGTGKIYSKTFSEKSLTSGNYAMGNTEFIALTLCEGEP